MLVCHRTGGGFSEGERVLRRYAGLQGVSGAGREFQFLLGCGNVPACSLPGPLRRSGVCRIDEAAARFVAALRPYLPFQKPNLEVAHHAPS